MKGKKSKDRLSLPEPYPWHEGLSENRGHWTIRELFDWAKEKNLLDIKLLDFMDDYGGIGKVHHVEEVFNDDGERWLYLY